MQNWLPSIPTLLSPSGCYISLEITFQPLRSSQPLITQVLAFDIFFLCCIVCRILILRPGIEVVPPALEAQRHNHWASRTAGHPRKFWCLHLRSSVVSSREGNGTPLFYSCLENPMDGGTWWAAVHGDVRSQKRLSNFTFTFHFHALEKEMETHSSVLAWRIPGNGVGGPGGLLSLGSHRIGHD